MRSSVHPRLKLPAKPDIDPIQVPTRIRLGRAGVRKARYLDDAIRNRKSSAILVMLATPLFFSTNVIFGRYLAADASPFLLALLRWAAVAVLLSPFLWRERAAARNAIGASPWRPLVLGMLGMVVCGAVVYVGLARTTATNGNLIYARRR